MEALEDEVADVLLLDELEGVALDVELVAEEMAGASAAVCESLELQAASVEAAATAAAAAMVRVVV